jgi:glycine/D-amino acid oxidase-like deaminating enzyme
MGPEVDPVAIDEAMPQRVDVVIVGGGIIGTSAALFLAQKGVSVALCEKGHIAGEQSSRNWGWVRKMMRDPRELPLIIESLRLWQGMNETVGAETGFRQSGILYVCDSDEDVAKREAWLEHARLYQLDSRLVAGNELAALLPGATRRYKGALYTPSDGRAEPQKAAPAIATAARRHGVRILAGCAVRGIETAAGRVAGAVTEKGRIACNAVVLAGGAWSRLFCSGLGLRLPQLKVLATVMRTAPLAAPFEHAAWTAKFAFRKRLDGGYTVANGHSNVVEIVPDSFRFFLDFLPALRQERGSLRLRLGRRFLEEWRLGGRVALDRPSPYEAVRVLDPAPVTAINDEAKASLGAAFPVFNEARIVQHWAGLIDVMPDAVPVISAVDAVPGFFIATGFSGHGFGIGPGAGRLVADLVTGARPVVDPAAFRFTRFSDGSRPRPDAGL